MSLTSQLITDVFPDLDKVEKLNKEAFPEEERVPLSEFYAIRTEKTPTFLLFITKKSLSALLLPSPIKKLFISAFLPSCPT